MSDTILPREWLLVFDVDGTLYRTETSFGSTMRDVYAGHGIAYPGDAAIMAYVGEPFDQFLEWLRTQGFSTDKTQLAKEITTREYASIARDGELYPGVVEGLQVFHERGLQQAICSNGDHAYVDAILSKFGLSRFFQGMATHAESGLTKTAMVAQLIASLRPKRTLVIGDRIHDFKAGRANHCLVIAAGYGFSDDWRSSDVDVVLSSFSDLPVVVDDLLRGR